MTTGPELGDVPIEDDPTGMRALLSSLPEPDPMPPELHDRILAALAQEAGIRSGADGSDAADRPDPVPPVPARGDRAVTHLHEITPRRRRSLAPWLAAAAVLAVIALGGGSLISSLINGDSSLSSADSGGASMSGDGSAEAAPEEESATGSMGPTQSAPGTTAESPTASNSQDSDRSLAADSVEVTEDGLAATARAVLDDEALAALDEGSLFTQPRFDACVRALTGTEPARARTAEASFEGEDAALVVVDVTGVGPWTAYVVGLECFESGEPTVFAGPVEVP